MLTQGQVLITETNDGFSHIAPSQLNCLLTADWTMPFLVRVVELDVAGEVKRLKVLTAQAPYRVAHPSHGDRATNMQFKPGNQWALKLIH